jgi:hypothetical protein
MSRFSRVGSSRLTDSRPQLFSVVASAGYAEICVENGEMSVVTKFCIETDQFQRKQRIDVVFTTIYFHSSL